MMVGELLRKLMRDGPGNAARVLADRIAAHASLDDLEIAVGWLEELREAGAEDAARTLADRAAACASLTDPLLAGWLLQDVRPIVADDAFHALADRVAVHASLAMRTIHMATLPDDVVDSGGVSPAHGLWLNPCGFQSRAICWLAGISR
jgi:hypothetical protein